MYILNLQEIIQFDGYSILYIFLVIGLTFLITILFYSMKAMDFVAGSLGLRARNDLEPMLNGMSAGLIGGQYFLLIKLLGETAEAAILSSKNVVTGFSTFVILAMAVCLGVAHLYFWRRGMRATRMVVFIPIYRFWFLCSGVVASLVF